MLSTDDARLVSFLHGGFPLSDRPFADVAVQLGCSEDAVIDASTSMLAEGSTSNDGGASLANRFAGAFLNEYLYTTNSGTQTVQPYEKVRVASDYAGGGAPGAVQPYVHVLVGQGVGRFGAFDAGKGNAGGLCRAVAGLGQARRRDQVLTRLAGRAQSGYVFHYAFAMVLGVVALITWLTLSGAQ